MYSHKDESSQKCVGRVRDTSCGHREATTVARSWSDKTALCGRSSARPGQQIHVTRYQRERERVSEVAWTSVIYTHIVSTALSSTVDSSPFKYVHFLNLLSEYLVFLLFVGQVLLCQNLSSYFHTYLILFLRLNDLLEYASRTPLRQFVSGKKIR